MVRADFNKQKEKTPITEQDPQVRATNFDEVCLGYTEEEAQNEARRCMHCPDTPCEHGCPVGVTIPDFLAKIADGDFEEAYEIVHATNALPAICGRVCPQENQCEGVCNRGRSGEPVAVGRLERFVADYHAEHSKAKHVDSAAAPAAQNAAYKVACIGSGPASLTCAGVLAHHGVAVTVFEALHKAGGVLSYGIPEFRLPKDLVAREISHIEDDGVNIELNAIVGKLYSIEELRTDMGFDAVFVATGAGLPSYLNIPGEGLNGVMVANELLTRVNLMKGYCFPHYATPVYVGKHCVVVGGGNVAMDSARTAKRLGADVTVVYRRTKDEMPARAEEVHHAEEEGIHFQMLSNPVQAHGNEEGWITELECVRMELGEPDASGRRRPIPIQGSNFTIECDMLVPAVGSKTNPLVAQTTPGLDSTDRNYIVVDPETGATSIPGVFAGGDTVSGAATVIKAMGAGKSAAAGIIHYLER